jgi:hypothetical protein
MSFFCFSLMYFFCVGSFDVVMFLFGSELFSLLICQGFCTLCDECQYCYRANIALLIICRYTVVALGSSLW